MPGTHREAVEALLQAAAADHERALAELPAAVAASLPVDAQGLTRAIDHLADAAGLSMAERRALVRPHAINPAVMHVRVYGLSPLEPDTVAGAFVEGCRVRADALTVVAEAAGGPALVAEIQTLLVEHPPPAGDGPGAIDALRATHAAQQHAALRIASALDED